MLVTRRSNTAAGVDDALWNQSNQSILGSTFHSERISRDTRATQITFRFAFFFFQASGLRRFVHYAFMSFRRPFLIDKRHSVRYIRRMWYRRNLLRIHLASVERTWTTAVVSWKRVFVVRIVIPPHSRGGRTLNRRQERIQTFYL